MLSKVTSSEKTRFKTYAAINSDMSMHHVYSKNSDRKFIPEHLRVAFTRMRTSSHRLRVEMGRWSGLDREDRTCKCGTAVGDERHVLTECSLTQHLRDAYAKPVLFPDILCNTSEEKDFKFIYDVLKVCE